MVNIQKNVRGEKSKDVNRKYKTGGGIESRDRRNYVQHGTVTKPYTVIRE